MIACFILLLLNKEINTSTEIQTFDILHWASRTKKTLKVTFLVGSKSKPWGRKYMISSIPSFGKSYFNLILGSHSIIIMLKLVEQKSYMRLILQNKICPLLWMCIMSRKLSHTCFNFILQQQEYMCLDDSFWTLNFRLWLITPGLESVWLSFPLSTNLPSLTFEGCTRCSVGVCTWGGSENGRDGKGLGEISFSEGWGAGEVPGEGSKENLIKEITCNPSTVASKQRKLADHETCSEVESNSASPHHRKEH